jgi:hypothetical protein
MEVRASGGRRQFYFWKDVLRFGMRGHRRSAETY